MTPHLSETEFVDLLDGALDAGRAKHLEHCTACRDTVSSLRATIAAVDDQAPPEPSPLFWDHFSARVRTAIEADGGPQRRWERLLPAARWAALATAATVMLLLPLWRGRTPAPGTATPSRGVPAVQTAAPPDTARDDVFGDLETDDGWALVRTIADELDEDEIRDAGIAARPGSIDRAAGTLSDLERAELARLIEHEVKRAASPGRSS